MSFIQKIFNTDIKLLRRLTTRLARILLSLNMDEEEAVLKATEIINEARHMMEKTTHKIPPGYADKVISGKGFKDADKIKGWLKNEGVNDEDIRWWDSLPDLEKWVKIHFDEWQMDRARKKLLVSGKPEDEVDQSMLRLFPRFDFIDEIGGSDFPDRALPHELRRRVERWVKIKRSEGISNYWNLTQKYSSMNALIRDHIMQRVL